MLLCVLNLPTHPVFECCECCFGTFPHCDDNLFVGNGGDISGSIDPRNIGAAVGVYYDFTRTVYFYRLPENTAVGHQSYLYKNAV